MGKSNALIGVGAAGYPSLYGSYRKRLVSNPRYSSDRPCRRTRKILNEIRSPLTHNEYLETFVELGIVGLLLFFAFWAQVALALWRRIRSAITVRSVQANWTLGALIGLIAFGVSSFTSGFSLRYTPQAIILACALSVGFASARTSSRRRRGRKATISFPRVGRAGGHRDFAHRPVCIFAGRNYNVLASQRLQGSVNRFMNQWTSSSIPIKPGRQRSLAAQV